MSKKATPKIGLINACAVIAIRQNLTDEWQQCSKLLLYLNVAQTNLYRLAHTHKLLLV
jgi:hypothetical protein